mgnify:CR=1 FL=1
MNPQRYGLIKKEVTPNSQRTLVLISKAIQSLGNFTSSQKEDYMAELNTILRAQKMSQVKLIIDNLCQVSYQILFFLMLLIN